MSKPSKDSNRPPGSPLPVPRVSPVGVVEYPDDFTVSPREIKPGFRVAIWGMLVLFTGATLVTSILSVGAYCLTSDGADTRALYSGPVLSKPLPSTSGEPRPETRRLD